MAFMIPADAPSACIVTFDGGSDHLLPGRWIASLRSNGKLQEHGKTEDQAVANLKTRLLRDYPQIKWYQTLPVIRSIPF